MLELVKNLTSKKATKRNSNINIDLKLDSVSDLILAIKVKNLEGVQKLQRFDC
jgi:hypothetical protein